MKRKRKAASRLLSLLLCMALLMGEMVPILSYAAEEEIPLAGMILDTQEPSSEESLPVSECTCSAQEGEAHAEDCPLYESLTSVPECTCGAQEGEAHAEDCPLYEDLPSVPKCTCGAQEGEAHAEDCPLSVPPFHETQTIEM